jgi:DNA polymerase elongation subunit (family B)
MTDKQEIIFQVLDWNCYEESDEEDVEFFKIRLYGRNQENKTVFVKVDGYTPYFYVEIPKNWRKNTVQIFVEELKKKVGDEYKNSLKEYKIVERHKFLGFTNNKLYTFLMLCFNSHKGFRKYQWILKRPIYNRMLARNKRFYRVYETNIEPMLRCMHIRKLKSCGFIKINKYNLLDKKDSTISDINISTKWTNLQYHEVNAIQKFIIASFDIECTSCDGGFPQYERIEDTVIQIGTTFHKYGETECFYRHIITLGSCDDIKDADVEWYETEREVLIAWTNLIKRINPDVMTGWNIFGFDYLYLHERSKLLNCHKQFSKLSRLIDSTSEFVDKNLSSSAMGDNRLRYYNMNGRVNIDLMKNVRNNYNLTSYKLDSVASHFIREKIDNIIFKDNLSEINTRDTYGLKNGQYITIYYNDGLSDNKYMDGKKFKIVNLTNKNITVNFNLEDNIFNNREYKFFWCQAKDDVSPQDIFRLQEGSSSDRAIIAKYCLQDCELCNKLMIKLQVFTNNIGMSNVCSVPFSYIFLRGQGVKLFSLVAKVCRQKKYIIPVIRKKYNNDNKENEGYEGAYVYTPHKGVYYVPIVVLDYASLYPSVMMQLNLSHEMLVNNKEYENIKGYKYNKVTFNNSDGTKTTCTFAQKEDGSLGIIPEILKNLLGARKATKKLMKKESDPFKKSVYNGLQLAYKVTANSLYGQTGAPTSPIYLKEIAASTTTGGKKMLQIAESYMENDFPNIITRLYKNIDNNKKFRKILKKEYRDYIQYLDKKKKDIENIDEEKKIMNKKIKEIKKVLKEVFGRYTIKPKTIYGDTDSVFIKYGLRDKDGNEVTDKDALKYSIELGKLGGDLIKVRLDYPHDLEYEKTFWPFVIITKKRYVGMLYEFDINKSYQKSMGIVLKRRDNPDIVKIMVGGIVKKILIEKSTENAIKFTHEVLRNMLDNKYPLYKFVTTKTLKRRYENRSQIVHAVLADRMKDRDPGNAPQVNDRIAYAAVIVDEKKIIKEKTDRRKKGLREFVELLNNNKEVKSFIHDLILVIKKIILNYYNKIDIDLDVVGNYFNINYGNNEWSILKNKLEKEIDQLKRTKIYVKKCIQFSLYKINDKSNNKLDNEVIPKAAREIMEQSFKVIENYKKSLDNYNNEIKQFKNDIKLEPNKKKFYKKKIEELNENIKYKNQLDYNDIFKKTYLCYLEKKVLAKAALIQGDIVEDPKYIVEQKLQIDYLYYIMCQMMKPSIQFLELLIKNPNKIFDKYINEEKNRRAGKLDVGMYLQDNNYDKEKNGFDDIGFTFKETVKKPIIKKKKRNKKKISVDEKYKTNIKKNKKGKIMLDMIF